MLGDEVHATDWIRAITEDVPEADDPIAVSFLDVPENHLECLKVAVDITDDGRSHGVLPNGERWMLGGGPWTVNGMARPVALHLPSRTRGGDFPRQAPGSEPDMAGHDRP